MEGYVGQQYVGMDLHRRRSVIVRTTDAGQVLELDQLDADTSGDSVADQLEVVLRNWSSGDRDRYVSAVLTQVTDRAAGLTTTSSSS